MLVRRHGPMVLAVCRRILRDPHDVEDAFQATFLVLVRKAASLKRGELVGNWLHGVARRTALEARTAAYRRRVKEGQVKDMADRETPPEPTAQDLRLLLDQELEGLPEKYRAAILLCDLEGKTRKEAARQLGWSEGTLSGRLARARRLLARRLQRHGFSFSSTALVLVLAPGAASALPFPLLDATLLFATPTAGAISPSVSALAEGVLKTMLLARLKLTTAVVLLLTLLGSAGILLAPGGHAAGPAAADKPTNQPVAKENDRPALKPAKIYVGVLLAPNLIQRILPPARLGNVLLAIDPETGEWTKRAPNADSIRLAPDQKTLLFQRDKEIWRCANEVDNTPIKVAEKAGRPIWSPDGKSFVVSEGEITPEDHWKTKTWRTSADGTGTIGLPIPDTDFVEDWSADGQWLVTSSDRHPPRGRGYQLYLMRPDAKEQRRLTKDGLNCYARFSPNGQRILFLHQDRTGNSLHVMDRDGKNDQELIHDKKGTRVDSACWSPDGKRIAVVLEDTPERDNIKSYTRESSRLVILDADGQNQRQLKLAHFTSRQIWAISHPDWR
jgi:RNA polymerase sigma factor (sigma-70 family)